MLRATQLLLCLPLQKCWFPDLCSTCRPTSKQGDTSSRAVPLFHREDVARGCKPSRAGKVKHGSRAPFRHYWQLSMLHTLGPWLCLNPTYIAEETAASHELRLCSRGAVKNVMTASSFLTWRMQLLAHAFTWQFTALQQSHTVPARPGHNHRNLP